jgi:hypothetical protein
MGIFAAGRFAERGLKSGGGLKNPPLQTTEFISIHIHSFV